MNPRSPAPNAHAPTPRQVVGVFAGFFGGVVGTGVVAGGVVGFGGVVTAGVVVCGGSVDGVDGLDVAVPTPVVDDAPATVVAVTDDCGAVVLEEEACDDTEGR